MKLVNNKDTNNEIQKRILKERLCLKIAVWLIEKE